MKKLYLLAAMALFVSVTSCGGRGGEVLSEAEYLHLDSVLWLDYGARIDSVRALYEAYPEKIDSMRIVLEEVLNEVLAENASLALRYISVPEGLKRVFMTRLDIPKDTLRAALERIPADLVASSPYAEALRLHVENDQIEEGDRYYDFAVTLPDGSSFTLSSLEGKRILLMYGGLDCMGEAGRSYLKSLYDSTSRDSFEIVVYQPCASLGELGEISAQYSLGVLQVSDFEEDRGVFKIIYGTQATPTCILIDRDGIVRVKSIGLAPERFAEYF